ncbi:unnamed protein product [Durusdinium trenchii]|uniref:Uncharacterized protein n=1 Tax=Durusdinium trenchii TaxID=1381693 RepID=A0ABP0LZ37_9DINO
MEHMNRHKTTMLVCESYKSACRNCNKPKAAWRRRYALAEGGFDSSPLKRDYFLCYETTIESDRSILLCQDLQRNMNKEDASEDDPLFSLSGDIECRVLPPVALGKGDGTGGGHVDLEGQTSGPLNCCLRIGCPPCSFSEPIGFRPCSAHVRPCSARILQELPDSPTCKDQAI